MTKTLLPSAFILFSLSPLAFAQETELQECVSTCTQNVLNCQQSFENFKMTPGWHTLKSEMNCDTRDQRRTFCHIYCKHQSQ